MARTGDKGPGGISCIVVEKGTPGKGKKKGKHGGDADNADNSTSDDDDDDDAGDSNSCIGTSMSSCSCRIGSSKMEHEDTIGGMLR